MAARHLITGRAGEDAALRHLTAKGFRVLATNWRHGGLELDAVCAAPGTPDAGEEIVFVEVRTRGPGSLETPAESLTRAKMAKLVRAASEYLSRNDLWDRPCRFDLVSVRVTDHGFALEHITHAFDLTQALGRGHAAWQPW